MLACSAWRRRRWLIFCQKYLYIHSASKFWEGLILMVIFTFNRCPPSNSVTLHSGIEIPNDQQHVALWSPPHTIRVKPCLLLISNLISSYIYSDNRHMTCMRLQPDPQKPFRRRCELQASPLPCRGCMIFKNHSYSSTLTLYFHLTWWIW